MKAAVVPAIGRTWRLEDVPAPKPEPNQVLLRIRASGLCYIDVHMTNGALPGEFPRTLGHEPLGEIVEIGVGVRTRRVGDRVGVPIVQTACGRCEWCLRGKSLFCPKMIGTSMQMRGGHADYMLA
jgi:alcohol dehydrogenase